MKDQKQILAKLMSLGNANADKYLVKFAQELREKILTASTNEEALEGLDLLEEFIYKVPKISFEIIGYLIKNPIETKVYDSQLGKMKGKDYSDVAEKIITLLEHLRYIDTKEVLRLTLLLFKDKDTTINPKAKDLLKKTAKYDYNVLVKSKMGYGIQGIILDFLIGMSQKDRLSNIDFIEIAAQELLEPDFEGTTMTDEKTLVMHSGPLTVTPFLKDLRKKTIDFIFDLYGKVSSGNEKLKLIRVLEEAAQTPGHVLYGDDLLDMVNDDISYLIKIYEQIVFGADGKMIEEVSLVSEIEKKLYWMNRSEKKISTESKEFRKKILSDRFYSIYRLLVCDQVSYREEEGWDTAEGTRNEKIASHIASINPDNIAQWIADINLISDQQKVTEEWHFLQFKSFLRKLSYEKPGMAEKILDRAYLEDRSVKTFVSNFLDGFRDANRLDLWDKFVDKIIDKKDPVSVAAICYSLNLADGADLKEKIRDNDLDILEEIVEKKVRFSFLKESKERNNLLHYALLNSLIRNHQRNPKRIEKLIIKEMKGNPEYLILYFRELPIGTWKKWVDWSNFDESSLEFLKEKLIEIPDLDWHEQGLMLDWALGKIEYVLDVFKGRIEKDDDNKKEKGIFEREHYDSIPYHFNPELQAFISTHPEYKGKIIRLIDRMTEDWSVYNWHLAHLIQRAGVSFDEIVLSLIEKGGDISLMRAARLMRSIEGGDVALCIAVAGKTDNKKILSQLDAIMYSTGVVMGEDGITRAYKARAKELEVYIKDKNPRVKKFAKRLGASFLDSAKRERKRMEEEIKLRKIEFNG